MKRRELLRHLNRNACVLLREGACPSLSPEVLKLGIYDQTIDPVTLDSSPQPTDVAP